MFFSCKSNLEDVKKFGISQNAPVGETEAINLKYTDSGKGNCEFDQSQNV